MGPPKSDRDINLLDLDRWARDGAPYHWFAELRRHAPVWRHPSSSGPGFWVVSRHSDVTALGRCPHVLSSDSDNGGVTGLGPGDEAWEAEAAQPKPDLQGDDAKMLLTLDPPEHTTYRKIVNRAFTPARIKQLEPAVHTLAAGLLSALPDHPIDFTTDVAAPLPMRVISDMIGAPTEDHDRLAAWGNQAAAGTDPEYDPGPGGTSEPAIHLLLYFHQLREQRQAEPRDDLCSVLVEAEIDGEGLAPVRFAMFLFLLALAGNETTRNAISHGVLAFAQHPDQWDRLRADPTLLPTAVEEILRWASPISYFRRTAVSPMDIGGEHIEVGDIVSLWYPSANRDEDVFTDPDDFDISRMPNDHVTFGGGGPHFCLGASLARLEIRVLLELMVDRYARIELAGTISRLRSNFLNGIKHLPVKLVDA